MSFSHGKQKISHEISFMISHTQVVFAYQNNQRHDVRIFFQVKSEAPMFMKIIEKLPFLIELRHFEQIELLSKNFSPITSTAYDITFITKHGIAYNISTRPQNNIINMRERFPKRFNSLASKKKCLLHFSHIIREAILFFIIIIFRQFISVEVGEWSILVISYFFSH